MAKKWHAEIWRGDRGKRSELGKIEWEEAKGGFVWPDEYAEETVGDIEYGTLFAYMFRRFGPPEIGSDGYKEIANWLITTPDENVALEVSPSVCGIKHHFGYCVNTKVYNDRRDPKQTKAVDDALKSAMKDLLVPTNVRDVCITAAGDIDDYPDETCEYFKWAGYGVVPEYFEERFGKDKPNK